MTFPLLTGKTALITGASRGIGLGIAHSLARNGVHCILVGRDPHTLDSQLAQLPNAKEHHAQFAGDVAVQDTWTRFEAENVRLWANGGLILEWEEDRYSG
jgi:short-subunit dehydrogenase